MEKYALISDFETRIREHIHHTHANNQQRLTRMQSIKWKEKKRKKKKRKENELEGIFSTSIKIPWMWTKNRTHKKTRPLLELTSAGIDANFDT